MDDESTALVELLRTSRRAPLRLQAVQRLAERRDPDTAPALLDTLEESSDPRVIPVVTAALDALREMGPAIGGLLVAILDDTSDPRRVFMPLLLASTMGAGALARLIAALRDPQQAVQINAATQLGQMGHISAFEPLLGLLEDHAQPASVRGVAAAALGALRDRRALPVLAALAASSDPDLLAGAIDGLADLRDPAGIPYLEAILERNGKDERINRAVRLGLLAMERYRER